ncbi:MAG: DUF1801 domain-containing protein [Acidimicrobiia bacterium]
MAKPPRKPNSTRKPPVPSDSHDEIERLLGRAVPEMLPIVQYLDALFCEQIAGLQYGVKWKKAHYGLPDLGWIMELVPYEVSVNVVFFGGADFDPPPPLGDTDRSRYVKLRTLDEAKAPDLLAWVQQAADVQGWT